MKVDSYVFFAMNHRFTDRINIWGHAWDSTLNFNIDLNEEMTALIETISMKRQRKKIEAMNFENP